MAAAADGLQPGVYEAAVDTDSSMVNVVACYVEVAPEGMVAHLSLHGKGFSRLYVGTAAEAAQAAAAEGASASIADCYLNADGWHTFAFSLPAFDEDLAIALYGQRRDTWYDHVVVVHAPTAGPVQADLAPASSVEEADDGEYATPAFQPDFRNANLGNGWQPTASPENAYATRFSIDCYEGGYALVCVADGARYLSVPEGADVPAGLASDIVVLQRPVQGWYLCASDTMCLFDALDAIDAVSCSALEADRWSVPAAVAAMQRGDMVFAGKFSAPDYELLLARGVTAAVESTMIYHAPAVREKLEDLGIAVVCEQSSLEDEPLGRAEWVRAWGALLGRQEAADAAFRQQVEQVQQVQRQLADAGAGAGASGASPTCAFFSINAQGQPVVRRPGDYVAKMIQMAGGTYAFDDLAADGAASTIAIDAETFLDAARSADVIVYNATIEGPVANTGELVARFPLLADFAAVKAGRVYCTDQNMYQQMVRTGDVVADFNRALLGDDAGFVFLEKLE